MPTNHLHLQPRSRMNSAICLLTLYVTFFTITEILCSRLYYGHASRSRLDWSGGAARTLHYAVSRKHQSFYLHCETVIIFSKSVARKRTVNLLSRQHTLRGNSWHVNNALRTWAPRTLKRHSSLKDLWSPLQSSSSPPPRQVCFSDYILHHNTENYVPESNPTSRASYITA